MPLNKKDVFSPHAIYMSAMTRPLVIAIPKIFVMIGQRMKKL